MEAILKVAPGAFELFWRSQPSSNDQQSEVIVRASYAVTQPTLRECRALFCYDDDIDGHELRVQRLNRRRSVSLPCG